MASQTPSKLTYDDYLEIPIDGRRYEIVDGELYVHPSPGLAHQQAIGNISALLWNYMRAHHTGRVFVGRLAVILSSHDVVEPDVMWVSSAHRDRIVAHGIEGPPDLVIEVLSREPLKLDEKTKRKRYAFFDVPEYWIVDPERERVRIFRRRRRGLDLVAELEGDAAIISPILPGFSITPFDIFHAHEV